MTEKSEENVESGKVLVLDDDQDIVDVIDATIRMHTSLIPFKATSGKEGLVILEATRIDVILLDLSMPRMDGIEFFKIIRNKSILAPVIFLTGKNDHSFQEIAFELGAFDFLQKPVKASDLTLLIDEAYKVSLQVRSIIAKKDAG